jgi:hypothetical protein
MCNLKNNLRFNVGGGGGRTKTNLKKKAFIGINVWKSILLVQALSSSSSSTFLSMVLIKTLIFASHQFSW